MSGDALPRFVGPAQNRQRMRLAAAIGMLAVAAIAVGSVASLASGRPVLRSRPTGELSPPLRALATPEDLGGGLGDEPGLLEPAKLVADRVGEAEAAVARARAALRSARQLDAVDPTLLDELERRLERLTGQAERSSASGPAERNDARRRVMTTAPREL